MRGKKKRARARQQEGRRTRYVAPHWLPSLRAWGFFSALPFASTATVVGALNAMPWAQVVVAHRPYLGAIWPTTGGPVSLGERTQEGGAKHSACRFRAVPR